MSNVGYNTGNASLYPPLCFYKHVLYLLAAPALKPDTELQKKSNAMYQTLLGPALASRRKKKKVAPLTW